MKKKAFSSTIALTLILVFSLVAFSQMQSENYRITTSVISNGGGPTASDNFLSNSTMGQSSPLMDTGYPPYSDNYENYPGFWYTALQYGPAIDNLTFDQCISELCSSAINVSAHDPAGGNLTYEWNPLNGGIISGAGESVEFEPPDTGPHACPYQVELTITSDASGLSLSQTMDIYVKLAGNVNGDGNVNVVDKVLVRNSFGQSGDPGWIDEDVNCDGYVNVVDKVLVRNQFGDTCCGCP
jgi:hypothetical protein